MSRIIEENGVSVRFPDENYFQFSKCPAYSTIKVKGVKETDVCWHDLANNTLWLVELKAFHNPENLKYLAQDLSVQSTTDKWISELADKSIHTVCMTTTNRSFTQTCIPSMPDNDTIIKIVHVIKVMPGQDTFLDPMQDRLRTVLKAYSAIFNISAVSIISYDFAIKNRLLEWIV